MKLRHAQDLMAEGSFLMQMHKRNNRVAWYLIPGGEVPDEIVEFLLKMPNIEANKDGLFPGISQTWRLKS